MAFTVQFGNGGAASVADLSNTTDQANYGLLTNQTQSTSTSQGQNFADANVGVAGGGNVAVSYQTGLNAFSFDVTGAWNSVKNVLAVSDSAQSVYFKDFVQADVHLNGAGNSTVEILNVKRGNVSTGDGADKVHVSLVSNDSGWVNAFNVSTGKGDDSISITKGASLASIGGVVNAGVVNGGAGIIDGSSTVVYIDAGEGNDTIDLHDVNLKASTVIGGKGVDRMVASGGADTFEFHLGDMTKNIFGTDTVEGFDQTKDKLKLDGTVYSDWSVQDVFGNAVLTYVGHGDPAHAANVGEKIVLSNTTLDTINHLWFATDLVSA